MSKIITKILNIFNTLSYILCSCESPTLLLTLSCGWCIEFRLQSSSQKQDLLVEVKFKIMNKLKKYTFEQT